MRAEELPRDGLRRVNFRSLKCPARSLDELHLTADGIAVVFGDAVCVKHQHCIRRKSDDVVGGAVFRKDSERKVCRQMLSERLSVARHQERRWVARVCEGQRSLPAVEESDDRRDNGAIAVVKGRVVCER